MQKRLANELAKKQNEQDKLEQWNDSVVDLWKRLEAHIIINHPEHPTPIPKQAPSIAPASIAPASIVPALPIPGLYMLMFDEHFIMLSIYSLRNFR